MNICINDSTSWETWWIVYVCGGECACVRACVCVYIQYVCLYRVQSNNKLNLKNKTGSGCKVGLCKHICTPTQTNSLVLLLVTPPPPSHSLRRWRCKCAACAWWGRLWWATSEEGSRLTPNVSAHTHTHTHRITHMHTPGAILTRPSSVRLLLQGFPYVVTTVMAVSGVQVRFPEVWQMTTEWLPVQAVSEAVLDQLRSTLLLILPCISSPLQLIGSQVRQYQSHVCSKT